MVHRVEVTIRSDYPDSGGEVLARQIADDLGIQVESVRVVEVYHICADLTPDELEQVRTQLFTDPVLQVSAINRHIAPACAYVIEVCFRPGVTDNVGKSAAEGIADVLRRPLAPGEAVFTAKQYAVRGGTEQDCQRIARELLANELIQQWAVISYADLQAREAKPLLPLPWVTEKSDPTVHTVSLERSDEDLVCLSRERMLALDLREMQAIRDYYRRADIRRAREARGLPSDPTDIELEILAQTWSEHCKHKIFAAEITYTDEHGKTRVIDGLFKTYIRAVTEALREKCDWLVSVFHDNAGIIQFDENHHLAMKVETHNSPSALDPYGGAMTGIVGVNRDILGAGLGCRCIFNTDVFCFASPFYDKPLPKRLLPPRRVLRGVHAGVRDGGNQSGIPTVNGAIVFHERFLGKPLVFCGTGGIIPAVIQGKPSHEKKACPGDAIVMAGGRIGKDGIHGATFSSEALHEGSPATAVQIGDPITQKKLADFLLEARDRGLYRSVTDNGAGGLSSSVGEMARSAGGARVHLDRAPLKYAGLAPWEIFLSEAQERMTFAVPPEHLAEFMKLANQRNVEATALGEFTDSGYLECFYKNKIIAALDMDFLHDGVPRMRLKAVWRPPKKTTEIVTSEADLTHTLQQLLGSLNICSKETFVRMYDHEVQGGSVLKPFQGVERDGPGDAAVVRPLWDSKKGVAVGCGICPKYSDLDTYAMMACAVDEAVRNVVAVGAKLGRIAGLDNFCWPDPIQSDATPDGAYKLGQLVRCCEALYDACLAYGIPLISGKDSMKNDYHIGDTKISIPPTVLFTAIAVLDDVTRVVSMDAKRPADVVYLVGETRAELGGSEYSALKGCLGSTVPTVNLQQARAIFTAVHKSIEAGLVSSCHDCSDGGLAVALAETAFAGGLGMVVDVSAIPLAQPEAILFSETPSRFVLTVPEHHVPALEQQLQGVPYYRLGNVVAEPNFRIHWKNQTLVESNIAVLKEAWQRTLRW